MHRRDFLGSAGISAIACLAGLLYPRITFSDDKIIAGNLYLYDADSHLSENELNSTFTSAIKVFEDNGIYFNKATILNENEFPQLSGLDILLCAVDNHPSTGLFGINTWYNSDDINGKNPSLSTNEDYKTMKQRLGFPYDQTTAEAHIGYICPETFFRKIKTRQSLPDEAELSSGDRILGITNLIVHEVSHGLGASHVKNVYVKDVKGYIRIPSPDDYLGDVYSIKRKRFIEENIEKMREFCDYIRNNQVEDDELIEIRERMTRRYYYFPSN